MAIKKEVYDILTSISKITGLGVCLYDLKRFFTYNYGGIEKLYTGHYCEFCKAIRDLPGGRSACINNDVITVKDLALSYKKPFFNVCHIGICEFIVPIMKNDNLLGIVFIGQCRIDSETSFDKVFENVKQYQGDYECFKKLFNQLPITSRQQLSSIGKLANFSFKTLVNNGDFHISDQQNDMILIAKDFINSNYMNNISLSLISNELHVNASYLSRKFKELTGTNISQHINNVRIEKAKRLLENTNIPIIHISYNVGFTDQNYFSRIFKQTTHQTPKQYRKTVNNKA